MKEIILRFATDNYVKYPVCENYYGAQGYATISEDITYTFTDSIFSINDNTFTTEIGTFRFPEGDITYEFSYTNSVFVPGSVNIFKIISGTKKFIKAKGIIEYKMKKDKTYKVTIKLK